MFIHPDFVWALASEHQRRLTAEADRWRRLMPHRQGRRARREALRSRAKHLALGDELAVRYRRVTERYP